MSALLVLPILIPLLAGAAALACWRSLPAQRVIACAGAVGLLVAGACLVYVVDQRDMLHVQVGNWPAPFGITLAADRLSAIMVALAGVMVTVVCCFMASDARPAETRRGFFVALMVLLAGCCGAFLTGDLFNLYVWFEVLLIASFVLLSLGAGRPQLEGGVKYVALNLVGSMLFLTGTGILYGVAKTLNMADLHVILQEASSQNQALVLALTAVFTLAFALKAALFPVFFWLPASYHVPPAGVSAIFAALLTKVGIYAMIRVLTLVFPEPEPVLTVVLVLAAITMVSGVLGAVTQFEMKRILAWHSISQVGYIVVGVGLLCAEDAAVRAVGLAATVVFLVHHGLVKPALFLIAGLVNRREGTTQLKPLGGLAGASPWLAALFLISALSLAGLPPSSGFWAKLAVVRATVAAGEWAVLAAALGAGVLTLLSMMKIWNEAFWKVRPGGEQGGEPEPAAPRRPLWPAALPVVALVGLITLIGLWPQPLLGYADRAAEQLLDPSSYVEAIGVVDAPAQTEAAP